MQILKITCENPEEILNASAFGSGALIRVESSTTGGGSGFTEIGTVALVSGTYLYTYFDGTGVDGTYYRTRYSNSAGSTLGDYGAEFRATEPPSLLCSIYDVKQTLGIAATDTADDEQLLKYCVEATAWIQSKTSQDFLQDPVSGTTVRLYDGLKSLDGNRLYIQGGFQSVSLLEIAIFTGGTYYTLPASVYFPRPLPYENRPGWPYQWIQMTDYTLISTTAPIFYPGTQNIRVTGVFGWPAVPIDISALARRITVNAWRARGSGSAGDTVSIGVDGQRQFDRILSAEDRRTLTRYMQEPLVIA